VEEKLEEWRKRIAYSKSSPEELQKGKEKFLEMQDKWYTVTRQSWAAYGPETRS